MEAAGVIVLVTPDRAAITDTRNTLETLEKVLGAQRSRYTLVINMWTEEAGLRRGDIVRFVGLAEAGVVPADMGGRMQLAVNQGQPYVLMQLGSRDPVPLQVVDALAGVTACVYPPFAVLWQQREGERRKQGGPGIIQRLFG